LPDTVRIVGDAAFMGCGALATVRLGAGIKEVGGYAFGNPKARSNASQVHFAGDMPAVGDDLGLDPEKCTIFVRGAAVGWGEIWQSCPVVRE